MRGVDAALERFLGQVLVQTVVDVLRDEASGEAVSSAVGVDDVLVLQLDRRKLVDLAVEIDDGLLWSSGDHGDAAALPFGERQLRELLRDDFEVFL